MSDSEQDIDPTNPKPRGLWSLMKASEADLAEVDAQPMPDSVDGIDPAHQTDSDELVRQPEQQPTQGSARSRGLWGMMGRPPVSADPNDVDSGEEQGDRFTEAFPPMGRNQFRSQSRGLYEMMSGVDAPPGSDEPPESLETSRRTSVSSFESDDEPDDDGDQTLELSPDEFSDDQSEEIPAELPTSGVASLLQVIDPADLEPPQYRPAARQARNNALMAIVTGILALLASVLSTLPTFLAGLPATATGFCAIICGYLCLTGAGRREISALSRGLALAGMVFGTVGIFLGPLLFAGLGRSLREANGLQATHRHLQQIGQGLDHYYTEKSGYPIGGTFERNDAGVIRGQHGWMTFLLPHIGETELYREIELEKAYDDPLNRTVMGRNVITYFAAGGDRARIGDGFAVSHFAGLGGEIDEEGLSHVGIFERDVAVTRDEVTDGLATTLIVGELAGTYPPWGDPENWRKIGRGLNKDINGFGSHSGNGATFLFADGTVKHFSNKTDPRILQQLSTRDGGEK